MARKWRPPWDNGTRVKIIGDLSDWTAMAQRNLSGATGTVIDYKPDYDSRYPAHLVELDEPKQVNPISTFKQAWINVENLSPLT